MSKMKRLSPQEMRKVLLANAKILMSEQFKYSGTEEVSGQRKPKSSSK